MKIVIQTVHLYVFEYDAEILNQFFLFLLLSKPRRHLFVELSDNISMDLYQTSSFDQIINLPHCGISR